MLQKLLKLITGCFLVWVILGSVLSYLYPEPLKGGTPYLPYCIGIILLTMGLNMPLSDLKLVISRPKDVLWGVIPRYLIMPFVAFGIAKLLDLPPALAAGLILVGCCPSAVASNIMTFMAKGDLALSVTVSSVNTLVSPLLTPVMFVFLAGTYVNVSAESMLLSILKQVLLPITIGILIRRFAEDFVKKITFLLPAISTLALLAIIFVGTAVNADRLVGVGMIAIVAVMLHNALGLSLGFWGARKIAGMDVRRSKAVSFEVGMENCGLAITLALAYLDPMAAIPATIFNVWHNITGAGLATYWAKAAKEDVQ